MLSGWGLNGSSGRGLNRQFGTWALTGSETLPVEVLAAGFAFAGGQVVGGVDGPLQVHPAPCCHGNNLSLPLGVGLWQRHLGQEVLHGTFTPLLQNSGTFRTLHKGLEHFFTLKNTLEQFRTHCNSLKQLRTVKNR